MVAHKENSAAEEPHYMVIAKLCEPDYDKEFKFLETELAFVERKMAEPRAKYLGRLSVASLGFFRREDWRKYRQMLIHYGKQLEEYSEAVENGVLPLKFAVHNNSGRSDRRVVARVLLENGRLDDKEKPPARPERMDGSSPSLKLKWPHLTGFSRRAIAISGHEVKAEFSELGAGEGAVLINQLVHVHCGPDTRATYEVRSRNVAYETGEVIF